MAHTVLTRAQRPSVAAHALEVPAAGGAAALFKLGPQPARLWVHAVAVMSQHPLHHLCTAQGTAGLVHTAHATAKARSQCQQPLLGQCQLGRIGQQHSLAAVVVTLVHHGALAARHPCHHFILFHLLVSFK